VSSSNQLCNPVSGHWPERELESVLPRFQLGQRSRPLPPLLFLDTMFLFDRRSSYSAMPVRCPQEPLSTKCV
uniref:Uncharacterized protein n=1 Tax=Poecilia mexicana TaxID=48701 RepID=A0A3B3X2T2_9TELE